MTYEIIKTPRNTIYLKVLQLAQELFGEDKVTDFEIDKDKLPMVRVDEGMNTPNNNKDMVGTVTMTVNFFSKTDFNQRNLLDSSLGRLHNALMRGELPKDDTYNIEVSGIEEPTPRYDKSTGETLLIKTLVIRLTYTKKPVYVETEPEEPIVIWAEVNPIEEGAFTISGTGTPNEQILVFISGGVVTSHTMRIGEDGTFSYLQGYSLKGGDIIKVLRLADGQELASYTIPEVSDGEDDGGYTPVEDFFITGGSPNYSIGSYLGKSQHLKLPVKFYGEVIRSISSNAFVGMALKTVEIPEGYEIIGSSAFRYNSLREIELPETITSIQNSSLEGNGIERLRIPSKVREVGAASFRYNSIENLILEEGVETIGNNAFSYNSLKSLNLPSTIRLIGMSAFQFNILEEVIIPDGVTGIMARAFANNRLERVVIPPSVTAIGSNAFDNDVEVIEEEDLGIQTMSISNFGTSEEEPKVDNSEIVIEGYRGTVAEQYAKENGHTFVALD